VQPYEHYGTGETSADREASFILSSCLPSVWAFVSAWKPIFHSMGRIRAFYMNNFHVRRIR
jgi:hypothetical protein